MLGKAEDNAPYRVNAYMVRVVRINTVGEAFRLPCSHITNGRSKPRDHRRCVNALAAGEGNSPTG